MVKKRKSQGSKKGGYPSKKELQEQAAGRGPWLVNRLYYLAASKNQNVAVSACNTLAKILGLIVHKTEVTGESGKPIIVNIIRDYVAEYPRNVSSSDTSP